MGGRLEGKFGVTSTAASGEQFVYPEPDAGSA